MDVVGKQPSDEELTTGMATQFARTISTPPPLPFLLGDKAAERPGSRFHEALDSAVAAEAARGGLRKPCQRIALFLCELGKAYGCRGELPLSRASIAGALGISLVKVKRSLALLFLSGVLSCDDETITILDWRKLSGVARFDASALDLASADEEEELPGRSSLEDEPHFLTASGDPACFV